MSDPVLIYGATGYTGRLIAEQAVSQGLRPLLGGRDIRKLRLLGGELGLDVQPAQLTDANALRAALSGVRVLLNAAGPFSSTLAPLADACLDSGVHYLDVTGEVDVIEAAAGRSEGARRRGLMLMPAVGFDVVPSDCLAAHVVARCPGATHLRIGIAGLSLVSRGSAKTIVERIGKGIVVRRAGQVMRLEDATPDAWHTFDFGAGPRRCAAVSWGDVASAFFTTGVPDIAVYFDATPAVRAAVAWERAWGRVLRHGPVPGLLAGAANLLPDGPSEARRGTRSATIVAEAKGSSGVIGRARLRTPEVYGFTAVTAVAVARRVLAGDVEPGFQTPARVYGPDFVLSLPGVSREDF